MESESNLSKKSEKSFQSSTLDRTMTETDSNIGGYLRQTAQLSMLRRLEEAHNRIHSIYIPNYGLQCLGLNESISNLSLGQPSGHTVYQNLSHLGDNTIMASKDSELMIALRQANQTQKTRSPSSDFQNLSLFASGAKSLKSVMSYPPDLQQLAKSAILSSLLQKQQDQQIEQTPSNLTSDINGILKNLQASKTLPFDSGMGRPMQSNLSSSVLQMQQQNQGFASSSSLIHKPRQSTSDSSNLEILSENASRGVANHLYQFQEQLQQKTHEEILRHLGLNHDQLRQNLRLDQLSQSCMSSGGMSAYLPLSCKESPLLRKEEKYQDVTSSKSMETTCQHMNHFDMSQFPLGALHLDKNLFPQKRNINSDSRNDRVQCQSPQSKYQSTLTDSQLTYHEHLVAGIIRRAKYAEKAKAKRTNVTTVDDDNLKKDTYSDHEEAEYSKCCSESDESTGFAENLDPPTKSVQDNEGDMNKHTSTNIKEQLDVRDDSTITFPYKLYQMLQEAEVNGNSHIVSFHGHGCSFNIHDTKLFVQDIILKYFTTDRLASFQRQLNIYGFKRITDGPAKGGYWHVYFLKDCPDLCSKIKRKRTSNSAAAMTLTSITPNVFDNSPITKQVQAHKDSLPLSRNTLSNSLNFNTTAAMCHGGVCDSKSCK